MANIGKKQKEVSAKIGNTTYTVTLGYRMVEEKTTKVEAVDKDGNKIFKDKKELVEKFYEFGPAGYQEEDGKIKACYKHAYIIVDPIVVSVKSFDVVDKTTKQTKTIKFVTKCMFTAPNGKLITKENYEEVAKLKFAAAKEVFDMATK